MCQRVLVKVRGQLLGSGAQTEVIRLCNKLYPRLVFCVKSDLPAWKAQNRRGEGPFLLITFSQPLNVQLMAHLDNEEELLERMFLMTLSNFTRSWCNNPDLSSLNPHSMRMLWAWRQSLRWKSISRATWTTTVKSLDSCGSQSRTQRQLDRSTTSFWRQDLMNFQEHWWMGERDHQQVQSEAAGAHTRGAQALWGRNVVVRSDRLPHRKELRELSPLWEDVLQLLQHRPLRCHMEPWGSSYQQQSVSTKLLE